MFTPTRTGRLAGAGVLTALLFTAACDSGESTAPTGLEPPEVGFNFTDEFVEPGAIWVCQETPSPDDVGHYSYIVGGEVDGDYGFPIVPGDNTETGEFEMVGSVFDDPAWNGNPADAGSACRKIPDVPDGTFAVTLKTPATFGHEDGITNPNRWAYPRRTVDGNLVRSFGNFLFETSYRDDIDCDGDGSTGGECPLRITEVRTGAIVWYKFEPDDIPPPPGIEGCTPGYWKQPQHFDSWPTEYDNGTEIIPITPDTEYEDVFGITTEEGLTLLEALEARGNRNGEALLRHSVAAFLNSLTVDYPRSTEDVIDATYAAWLSQDSDRINDLKDEFDRDNNLGCPLN